jgi:hypothetical protein
VNLCRKAKALLHPVAGCSKKERYKKVGRKKEGRKKRDAKNEEEQSSSSPEAQLQN